MTVDQTKRSAAGPFGQMISLVPAARLSAAGLAGDARVRALISALNITASTRSSSAEALMAMLKEVAEVLDADGVGLAFGDRTLLDGTTPTPEEFSGLARFLDRARHGNLTAPLVGYGPPDHVTKCSRESRGGHSSA